MSPTSLTPDRILGLGLSFWNARTLLSAVEIGVFTGLARGAADLETIRARHNLHPRSARDFLDALVALGMLERRDGLYSNTPEADRFLDRAKPTYVGGLLEMCSRRLYGCWDRLTEALHTGQQQNVSKGSDDIFGALYADERRLREFLSAMTGLSLGVGEAIAAKFPWRRYRTFVDVGAAQGAVPVCIARAHAHLTGVNFDLPVVGPVFSEYVASFGLSDRLAFQGGDFFKDPLPHADVVIMGHILHDWDLPTKQMLIAKAYAALPAGGSLLVFESLIDDDRRHNVFGLLMSLNMLIETPGGFDYTGADCIGWMREAGFREARVEHLCGPDSMVVGLK